jgi:hypothetical protein
MKFKLADYLLTRASLIFLGQQMRTFSHTTNIDLLISLRKATQLTEDNVNALETLLAGIYNENILVKC